MAFSKFLGLVCLNILSAYSNLVQERFDIFNGPYQKVLAGKSLKNVYLVRYNEMTIGPALGF